MTVGKNNPRVYAETVRLDAWRANYDDSHGVADLHIDVIFAPKGRVGGGDAPVGFLLSLNRAEVHVVCDAEHLIEILPETVMRPKLAEPAKLTRKRTSSAALKGKASVGASKTGVTAEAALSVSGSV